MILRQKQQQQWNFTVLNETRWNQQVARAHWQFIFVTVTVVPLYTVVSEGQGKFQLLGFVYALRFSSVKKNHFYKSNLSKTRRFSTGEFSKFTCSGASIVLRMIQPLTGRILFGGSRHLIISFFIGTPGALLIQLHFIRTGEIIGITKSQKEGNSRIPQDNQGGVSGMK